MRTFQETINPKGGLDFTGSGARVGWTWTPPTEATQKVHWSWAGLSRAPFRAVTQGSPNTDGTTVDHWVGIGFSPEVHFGGGTAGEPGWYMGFEDGWYDGALMGAEWYISYFSADHTTVQLFRPFYTRVQRNNNTDHSALTLLDIGTDVGGLFGITVGTFNEIFTVTKSQVTFKPLTGNGTFVLDVQAGSIPFLQFRVASANGGNLQAPNVDQLIVADKNNAAQMSWNTGGPTRFYTGLSVGNAGDGIYGPFGSNKVLTFDVNKLGFFNTAPVAKPTVTGAKGGNAALASLLTQLASMGLLTDSST
jgi:hypothetical protein